MRTFGIHYEAENERENVAKARQKGVAKARKSQILSKNMGESWVVLGWFLKKVGVNLAVFCRNLQVLKRGCRAFATLELAEKINVNTYYTRIYTDPPSHKGTAGQVFTDFNSYCGGGV